MAEEAHLGLTQNKAAAGTEGILKVKPIQWEVEPDLRPCSPAVSALRRKCLWLQKLAGKEQGLRRLHEREKRGDLFAV